MHAEQVLGVKHCSWLCHNQLVMACSAHTAVILILLNQRCPRQVMQLGEVEVVETWRDGDIRYEKEVQKPDYDRYNDLPLHKRRS